MECRDVQDKLNLYVEDLLSPREKRIVREHIFTCPTCSKALQELEKAISLLNDLDRIEPPPWLATKIMAHIENDAESLRGILSWLFRPFTIKIPIQALTLVLIVGLSVLLYRANIPEFDLTRPSENRQSEKAAPKATLEMPRIGAAQDAKKLNDKDNLAPTETHKERAPLEKHVVSKQKADDTKPLPKLASPQSGHDNQPASEVIQNPEPVPSAVRAAPAAPALQNASEAPVASTPQMRAPQSIPAPDPATSAVDGGAWAKKEGKATKPTMFSNLPETKGTGAEGGIQKDRIDKYQEEPSVGASRKRLLISDAINMVEKLLTSLYARNITKKAGTNSTTISAQVPSASVAVLTDKLSSYPYIKILLDKSPQIVDSGFDSIRIEITNP
jgi:hypothetical protein